MGLDTENQEENIAPDPDPTDLASTVHKQPVASITASLGRQIFGRTAAETNASGQPVQPESSSETAIDADYYAKHITYFEQAGQDIETTFQTAYAMIGYLRFGLGKLGMVIPSEMQERLSRYQKLYTEYLGHHQIATTQSPEAAAEISKRFFGHPDIIALSRAITGELKSLGAKVYTKLFQDAVKKRHLDYLETPQGKAAGKKYFYLSRPMEAETIEEAREAVRVLQSMALQLLRKKDDELAVAAKNAYDWMNRAAGSAVRANKKEDEAAGIQRALHAKSRKLAHTFIELVKTGQKIADIKIRLESVASELGWFNKDLREKLLEISASINEPEEVILNPIADAIYEELMKASKGGEESDAPPASVKALPPHVDTPEPFDMENLMVHGDKVFGKIPHKPSDDTSGKCVVIPALKPAPASKPGSSGHKAADGQGNRKEYIVIGAALPNPDSGDLAKRREMSLEELRGIFAEAEKKKET